MTVLLPRRKYGALGGRLVDDRTADEIAEAVSQVRGVAATIVPFDASTRPRSIRRDLHSSAEPQMHHESASSFHAAKDVADPTLLEPIRRALITGTPIDVKERP